MNAVRIKPVMDRENINQRYKKASTGGESRQLVQFSNTISRFNCTNKKYQSITFNGNIWQGCITTAERHSQYAHHQSHRCPHKTRRFGPV